MNLFKISTGLLAFSSTLYANPTVSVGFDGTSLIAKADMVYALRDTPTDAVFVQMHAERGSRFESSGYLENTLNLGIAGRTWLHEGWLGANAFYDYGFESFQNQYLHAQRLGLGFDYLRATNTLRLNAYLPIGSTRFALEGRNNDAVKVVPGIDASLENTLSTWPLKVRGGLAYWKGLGLEAFGYAGYEPPCSYLKQAYVSLRYGIDGRYKEHAKAFHWGAGLTLKLLQTPHCSGAAHSIPKIENRKLEPVVRDFRIKVKREIPASHRSLIVTIDALA